MAADIVIKGAREHNLRDVSLTLPRNKLICLTGVSGSGKSSLAFDTLYAEGQRRYVESLSSFARQFLGQMPKPDVDLISGLSPSISISQKTSGQNPRSTVGTITEIYDYLRVLFARCGEGHCPQCAKPITAQTREQIIDRIGTLAEKTKFSLLAPVVRAQKGEHRDLFEDLLKQGFVRARVDGETISLSSPPSLDRQMRHNIEVVVDRLTAGPGLRTRLAEAVDLALKIGKGNIVVAVEPEEEKGAKGKGKQAAPPVPQDEFDAEADAPADDDEAPSAEGRKGAARLARNPNDWNLSAHYACTSCGLSFEPPTPQLFSFNSPQGMCPECDGLGEVFGFDVDLMIPNKGRSFKQGAIETIGPWADLGRWRRHIFQGVADTLEHKLQLEEGTILETAWEELAPELQQQLLYGTGDLHITYTWRQGPSGHKYGGKYEGIIPELTSKYKQSKSGMQRRALEKYMRTQGCTACHGARLNPQARAVTLTTKHPRFTAIDVGSSGLGGTGFSPTSVSKSVKKKPTGGQATSATQTKSALSLPEICSLSVSDCVDFFNELELDQVRQTIAGEVLKEIRGRLGFLTNVGLEYLTLDRTAPTLSGGESQRIRLAGQIGCGLVGVLYILDEPSIGLHPRDNDRLLGTLERLRDLGNTVVVVEHDEDTMRASDYLIDFGPGPGVRGGEVVVAGDYEKVCNERRSLTGQFLSGERKIAIPEKRRAPGENKLTIVGAAANNLKGIDVEIPLGLFVCVTGASGSGKSSLVNDILVEALNRDLNGGLGNPGAFERMDGLDKLDKLISIDQSPIGRTPRSNPSTYIKVFDDIRKLYAQLPESKARGYQEGRFSFNVEGGRCEACEGNGSTRLEMDFLADVWVKCPVCDGHRFNRETLQVRFKGKNISEVLEMDIQEALKHFENIPAVAHKLQTLHDVGLDYLKLGQPSPTLSGGEAQRVKLARELVKKSTGRTLYLLDEPTTGLHFADISLLLKVLHDFAEAGNTVLVVEHNLDVIKTADWIIDLGPEGGAGGGRIIAQGTPEQVAAVAESHTGQALKRFLYGEGHKQALAAKAGAKPRARVAEAKAIKVQGARQHNLKSVDVEIPRDQITVCCGPSGSGKSSLAMDTIYAEGQRRYVESLSSYARQFVGQMQKPQLEHIEGLSPAIAIEQKHLGHTPRSTVGTVTEIYDYLRILFARLGHSYCPTCDIPIGTQTVDQIVDKIMQEPDGTKIYIMAPQDVQVGEKYETLFEDMRARGYQRMRVDGKTFAVEEPPAIDRRRKHVVEVVVDRSVVRANARSRIADSVESALDLGRGVIHVAYVDDAMPEEKWRVEPHSRHMSCHKCGRSFEPLSPHNFSFNSALGWCQSCEGLGIQTGANPAALLNDPKLTLADGAIALWPNAKHPLFKPMLQALGVHLGVPTNVPFELLGAKARRAIFHGRGEDWVEVPASATTPAFKFQYKGLYPALEEAARLSPALRGKLDHLVDEVECSICGGARLRDDAAAVRFRDRTIDEICRTPLGSLLEWVEGLKLAGSERKIAGELWREIHNRLRFLVDVGLEYLTIGRSAPTLSGGESQRIRLASQVGSGLTGVLYVLDEPTIGLHPRDNLRLINALFKLRDLGNTLLMVEHDKDVIAGADQLLDFGPRAGVHGGEVVARGTPEEVGKQKKSVTGPYLSGTKAIAIPSNRRIRAESGGKAEAKKPAAPAKGKKKQLDLLTDFGPAVELKNSGAELLEIVGASHNNLRHVDVQIPLGTLTVVTGVSGSGKSSLVEDVLYNSLARTLHRARTFPGKHDKLKGVQQINKVIRVDQLPLGQTPTSNPATYTGVFDQIRTLFANLPESKLRGYTPRRFSFNVPGGRCEKCEGNGQLRIEMHFLPDVWVECDECRGKRYNPETLAVQFRGCSIADVLDMPVGKALEVFQNIPQIRKILQTLCDVGLDYVTLGQPAPTLSGGEAQRVKLAAELSRPDTGRTLYLLDEPTTGLHFDDLAKLLDVLQRLVDLGNSVVVIEHNLDIIKSADWLIDMGPEAGEGGGYVVVAGTPEQVVAHAEAWQKQEKNSSRERKRPESAKAAGEQRLLRSYTGEMLAPILAAGPYEERKPYDPLAAEQPRVDDVDLDEVGEEAQMPWEADGRRWHTVDRVARNGKPCRWEGRILSAVIDKIHELGEFAPTNFNSRTIVEITGEKKSDGWFFHASTGEEWLLKLKFRTAKSTFKRDDVVQQLNLKPLNEMPDLPVYGTEPRVKCKNLRGPWQEVQLQVHSFDEIDNAAFWKFVEAAVRGFQKFADRVQLNPADVMPWKVLGQKWHFARKGFPPGKKVAWDSEVLEELCELLSDTAEGQFLWNNQQLIHFCLKGKSEPWATVYTKKPAAVELHLNGPKNKFALGRVTTLGSAPSMDKDRPDRDVVRLQFDSVEQINDEALSDFLNEHAEAAGGG